MARITTEVDIEVDLDDFDLDELFEEIEKRYKYSDTKEIKEWLNSFDSLDIKHENTSLLDEMKIDFIKRNLDRIKLSDLENLI
ncbi:MAG: hypothetical protein ACI9DK_003354 [Vicingaceae bacterium]|jgi:hypothetical protein